MGAEELTRYFPDRSVGIFVATWNMQGQKVRLGVWGLGVLLGREHCTHTHTHGQTGQLGLCPGHSVALQALALSGSCRLCPAQWRLAALWSLPPSGGSSSSWQSLLGTALAGKEQGGQWRLQSGSRRRARGSQLQDSGAPCPDLPWLSTDRCRAWAEKSLWQACPGLLPVSPQHPPAGGLQQLGAHRSPGGAAGNCPGRACAWIAGGGRKTQHCSPCLRGIRTQGAVRGLQPPSSVGPCWHGGLTGLPSEGSP